MKHGIMGSFHIFGQFFVLNTYRNDKFADVLLFTSQMDGGCGIPAHKIILSSCSHVRTSCFISVFADPF